MNDTFTTSFWYERPSILYQTRNLTEIFPSHNFDMTRKLNALVRLSVYFAIIMYVMNKDKKYVTLPLIVMGITWVIHYKQRDNRKKDIMKRSINDKLSDLVKLNDLETECRVPNKNNPFMNPKLTDFGSDKPPPPRSCPSYNNVGVQRRVEDLFNEDLYRDVNDIFGKNNSQRQFYTVPGSQVPNDQGSFAQWLYGAPPTCKEGNRAACLAQTGRGSSHGGKNSST